jgi:glycosyltransferase involved in cell wall biosynthesis
MTFVIITHVPHILEQNHYFAYAPYVREMNIWIRQANKVIIVAPQSDVAKTDIEIQYEHQNIEFVKIDSFDMLNAQSVLKAIFKIPKIGWCIFGAMHKADHIHLRCPGNIGLIGACVQILFPKKPKTAKYAGNWDSKAKQPWSYKLQKRILRSTFFTRKMQVLVYGQWESSSINIKSFFTASYHESDKTPIIRRKLEGQMHFVFVGTLVKGKNPLYALQIVEGLTQKGYNVTLSLYGEGIERDKLEHYIVENNLEHIITLKGNRVQEEVKKAYQESHFVLLPSESEGWPKAIAEGMFWGCVPVATAVSCVPFMLGYGNRGVLLEMQLEKDVMQLEAILHNQTDFDIKRNAGAEWSRGYTLDVFEEAIEKLLNGSQYNF